MNGNTGTALGVALAYFQAWTEHDFDRSMTLISDDIICHTPVGRLDGSVAFRGFMEPFTRSVTRVEMLAAFGDERTALLMYDADTVLVPHAPGAECLTVVDGMITQITIIFDRVPFAAARQRAANT
ncbi:nuclear transport factor 2 family protein [Nakamurella sp. PAMC28650]|uniref:nuclear transport factor 2 family protein n=1 Tax=Nakamurella sp. PAMC28650 TaxID=2762325 RepID=UPI00164D4679|nr:nuclear transport factor 2 family protein [Nakamurella sp. PAMC28650]QNK79947.1 nuclear transport factor 2 family protein [Nakamurella sp. PAMC28650]